jgi:hypothetical protein
MVGIRVVKSENWRKEENATKPEMLGKNFLAKTNPLREIRDLRLGSRLKRRSSLRGANALRRWGGEKIASRLKNSSGIFF